MAELSALPSSSLTDDINDTNYLHKVIEMQDDHILKKRVLLLGTPFKSSLSLLSSLFILLASTTNTEAKIEGEDTSSYVWMNSKEYVGYIIRNITGKEEVVVRNHFIPNWLLSIMLIIWYFQENSTDALDAGNISITTILTTISISVIILIITTTIITNITTIIIINITITSSLLLSIQSSLSLPSVILL
jgi:hypothetical protein